MAHSSAHELRLSIMRLARQVRSQKAEGDVTDGQRSVLFALEENGAQSLGSLSERERVTPPSMNRTVGKLVDAGLVSRRVDDDDRRRVVLETTEAGAAFVLETRRRRDEWLVPRLAALTADERRTLADATEILRKLTRS